MTMLILFDDQVFPALVQTARAVLEGDEFWRDNAFVGDKPVQRTLVKPKDNQFSIKFEVGEDGVVKPVAVGFDVESVGLPISRIYSYSLSAETFLKYIDQ